MTLPSLESENENYMILSWLQELLDPCTWQSDTCNDYNNMALYVATKAFKPHAKTCCHPGNADMFEQTPSGFIVVE